MGFMRASDKRDKKSLPHQNSSGIALFMVIAAISILSILVTEFTYISQINQKIAFDALDQVKAHYLAKSGFKLSLLRLKAYQKVKEIIAQQTGGATGAPGVSKQMLDRIWNFPFMYPIPPEIPGLTIAEKDAIQKFTKESGLEGSFTAVIESESSRYNLNMLLSSFVPTTTTTTTTAGGGSGRTTTSSTTSTTAPGQTGAAQFDPAQARASLADYLLNIFQRKAETDDDFADFYKGFQINDLVDSIAGWVDRGYEMRSRGFEEKVPYKRAPFYTLTELHMVPGMDDTLYELFAPALTVTTTPGINVNTMKEPILRALIPGLTDEEVSEFFKFRDSEEEDNLFKTEADFFKYVQEKFSRFNNDPDEVRRFKEDLAKKNIRLVTDESDFRITVQATVNQSTRLIEAWVTATPPKKTTGTSPTAPGANPPAPPADPNAAVNPATGGATVNRPDPGLKVTFMRVL